MFHVQPREWLMLLLLIAIPLAIAVVVTLWSIKQMAYTPKKPARLKPVLSPEDLARLSGEGGEAAAAERTLGDAGGIAPGSVAGAPRQLDGAGRGRD